MDKSQSISLSEIDKLVADKIITPEQAAIMKQRQQSTSAAKKQNHLTIMLAIIGSILIGAGVITLLAYNWHRFPQALRVILAFAPLLFSHSLMFYVWKFKREQISWCESAAIANTAGVFASLALIAQVFHLSANLDNYFLTCALLILPTMYLLNAVSPLIIYYVAIFSWCISTTTTSFVIGEYLSFFALCAGLLTLPLIIKRLWEKQPAANYLSFISYIYFICALIFFLVQNKVGIFPATLSLAAISLMTALFYHPSALVGPFALGGVYFYLILFYLTKIEYWKIGGWLSGSDFFANINWLAVVLLIITIAFGIYLINKALANKRIFTAMHIGIVAIVAVLLSLIMYWVDDGDNGVLFGQILANATIAGLGCLLIYQGYHEQTVNKSSRGLALICILIIMRFIDADLGLITKGIAFIILGIIFLAANYWLSKKIKQSSTTGSSGN